MADKKGLFFKGFKLRPLSGLGAKEVICFDFITDAVKAAAVKLGPGKRLISDLFYQDVRGVAREEIVDVLTQFLGKAGRPKDRQVVVSIPAGLVITKNIEIPSQEPKEIEEIINLQAGRLTPYSRDEVIIDHIRIGVFRQSYTKLLLVIVNKDVVQRQLALFAQAGCMVRRIVLASESLARLVHEHLKLELQDAPYAIIHTDATTTEFGIFIKERQVFLRNISIGAHHLLTEKEKALPRFIEELKKSLEAYHAEDIEASPSVSVFTGAVEKLKDLEVMMLDAFRMPIKVLLPQELIACHDAVTAERLSPAEISMLSVAGPALKAEAEGINLIPPEVKLRLALEARGREIIKAGAWAMAIGLFLVGIFAVNIYLKTDYLAKLTAKVKPLNAEAAKIEEDFNKVRTIRSQLAGRGRALNILADLYDRTSLEVALSNIRLKDDGTFSIRGEAGSMSSVFSYVGELEKSPYFKGVKTKYTAKKKVANEEAVEFEVACDLETPSGGGP